MDDDTRINLLVGTVNALEAKVSTYAERIGLEREAREKAEAERDALRKLVQDMIENDPYDGAADGVTVLDVWRKDARAALAKGKSDG